MSNYRKVKISEIAEVIGGGTPSTRIPEYWEGNIPWLTPKDLTNYSKTQICNGERNITELGLSKSSARLLDEGAVLLTSRAPIGYVAIAGKALATNQGFKSLIVKPKVASNYYLYYWLKGNTEYLNSLGTGTTFAEISGGVIKDIEIPLPPLPEQQAIAEVLSSLDDKIDLLHRNNKTLEEMAETLFRQWFLDTEFNSTINDVAEVLNGYAFKSSEFSSEGKNYVIKIKNIGGSSVNISDCDRISDNTANKTNNKFKVLTGDVLFAMTGAELGKMGIIGSTTRSLWLNQRVGSIKDRFNGSRYLAYLALNSELGQDFILNTASGSAQPNISGVDISRCPFPSISPEQIEEKSEVLNNLFDKVIHNLGQISILKETRDTLLPKLMSGQVVVN